MSKLEVVQGKQIQSKDEAIAYTVTTTPWGSSPASVVPIVWDETASNVDVTATAMPAGSASVDGDVITLPLLRALTVGHTYRVEVKFTSGGNIYEPYFRVFCER